VGGTRVRWRRGYITEWIGKEGSVPTRERGCGWVVKDGCQTEDNLGHINDKTAILPIP